MKKYLLRLIAVLLSLMIAAFFCPSFAVSVYASDEDLHGGGGSANHGKLTDEEKKESLKFFKMCKKEFDALFAQKIKEMEGGVFDGIFDERMR